jgi:hypothetical protein
MAPPRVRDGEARLVAGLKPTISSAATSSGCGPFTCAPRVFRPWNENVGRHAEARLNETKFPDHPCPWPPIPGWRWEQRRPSCTGLSVRAWRELIKLKAVRTEEGRGPGRVRICDRTNLKRSAVISALHQAGFSLAVAGPIALFLPYHTLLYEVCDPITILVRHSTEIDPKTGAPPRVERPMVDWFDPLKPAKTDAAVDWLIEIFDGRFVGVRYDSGKDAVTIFGDLREQGTRFVAWLPLPRRGSICRRRHRTNNPRAGR